MANAENNELRHSGQSADKENFSEGRQSIHIFSKLILNYILNYRKISIKNIF